MLESVKHATDIVIIIMMNVICVKWRNLLKHDVLESIFNRCNSFNSNN